MTTETTNETKGTTMNTTTTHVPEIEMTRRLRDGEGTVEFSRGRLTVTVYVFARYGSDTPVAEVNWSAIGSVDPGTAQAYAELITAAAEWAADANARQTEDYR